MQGVKGTKGKMVLITVDKNLYASAREYAYNLPEPISFCKLVNRLLREHKDINLRLKLKKVKAIEIK